MKSILNKYVHHLFFALKGFTVLAFALGMIFFNSCKKEKLITDASAKLDFSADTIVFDTVFVTFGSTNQQLLVYNNNSQPINISSIRLSNTNNSYFRLNVDGVSGTKFSDIEIGAKDSMFIFVEVTIDPSSANLPFIVADSIIFETNGNIQDVDLVAWGQNAHFIRADLNIPGLPPLSIIPCVNNLAEWDNVLPYVIFGYAVVDSLCVLKISKGTKIYFYNGSGLWVYRGGCIKIMGTKDEPVKFGGTRLESYYADKPGQWDRIWINDGAFGNEINYAEIKNGFIGLQIETLFDNNSDTSNDKSVMVNNTTISNMSGAGVFARYHNFVMNNCVISNCASYCAALSLGGTYEFNHCTFANYWKYGQRTTPSIYLNNYTLDNNDNIISFDMHKALFRNCIIYGNNENEIEVEMKPGGDDFYFFDHDIIKVKSDFSITDPNHFKMIYKNSDPDFKNTNDGDFSLDTMAFAKNKADSTCCSPLHPILQYDLKTTDRNMFLPADIGAIERKDQ
ncbi:MAG TPA: hypothetical protein PK736_06745 [Bacteroidia bacterium]|nr:hypothetical protein [Bacteroidia bacterium]